MTLVCRTGRARALVAAIAAAAGACGQGAVEVRLVVPTAESAQPTDATQIVIRADRLDADPVTRAAPIRDGRFDLGELPIDDYLGMTVELRNATGAQVGYGRSTTPAAVSDDGTLVYPVMVRRPRSYVIGNAPGVRSTDPLDGASAKTVQIDRGARDVEMLPRMLGVTVNHVAAGGADLFLASGTKVFRFDSGADALVEPALADVGGQIVDLAASTDGTWLAAATAGGVALIDTASGAIAPSGITEATMAVTFSRSGAGDLIAVALLAGVDQTAGCPGASRLAVTNVPGGETSARVLEAGTGLADIAGAADLPRVVAAGYCRNAAITYDLDQLVEIGMLGDVPAASVAAAGRDRAWVAGTQAGATTTMGGFEYTTVAALHKLATVTFVDGSGRVDPLPPLQQTVFTTDDETASFSQTIRAKSARVMALVPATSGDRVTVVGGALFRNVGRSFTDPNTFPPAEVLVVPPMAVHGSYAITIADGVGVTDRLRTRCKVCTFDSSSAINELGTGCGTTLEWVYKAWSCADEAGVTTVDNDLELGAGAALFGQP